MNEYFIIKGQLIHASFLVQVLPKASLSSATYNLGGGAGKVGCCLAQVRLGSN